jgi:hypothetical protein
MQSEGECCNSMALTVYGEHVPVPIDIT